MPSFPPNQSVRGRGAISNRDSRFEPHSHEWMDDGWGTEPDADGPNRIETTLLIDRARTILNRNNSPDIPFDLSINPYKGCEHGCIYCYARPSHAFLGLSPGLDFETKIFYKPNAGPLLDKALRAKGYRAQPIALGANTDPYQPIERRTRTTRAILEVLARFNHPVGIITKSALILRDLDILAPMAARDQVKVSLSITTLDRDLARAMEPRAATPSRRLEAIRRLSEAGVPTAVMSAPMIPGLTDHEMDAILEAAADAGAVSAGYTMLRLPLEIADLFTEWLREHAPLRADRVMSLVRQTRNGAVYDSRFGERMRGEGPIAELLNRRFNAACRRLGLNGMRFDLDYSRFAVPAATEEQPSLF
ncbi:MAG: PA0069 family radical SAM protein [Pseudomonadota bacterium]